jgi:hypothetical protein
MKSMCYLCIQFTHENTSERTILHLVKQKFPDPLFQVWLLALQKRLATALNSHNKWFVSELSIVSYENTASSCHILLRYKIIVSFLFKNLLKIRNHAVKYTFIIHVIVNDLYLNYLLFSGENTMHYRVTFPWGTTF